MTSLDERPPSAPVGVFDRLLGLFTDVHPGEGARAALMLVNIFVIMACSSVMKSFRDSLALTTAVPDWLARLGVGEAELTAYATSATAVVLMGFVPAYSWFASRVNHMRLAFGLTGLFAVNIVLFGVAVQNQVPFIGQLFYIWLGVFNMSVVAQFWSYANDTYTKDAAHRLFPIIGVGMTAGPPIGSWVTHRMFESHVPVYVMLYIAGAMLVATGALYELSNRRESIHHPDVATAPIGGKGAFSLVFASRYIGLIAVLLVLLNIPNTVGNYLLLHLVNLQASSAVLLDSSLDKGNLVGLFFSNYLFWTNITAVLLQIFVTPRLVKRFGLTGVLFALPFVSLGAYGLVAFSATVAVTRWSKTAENATDYSIMNTARQLLWLPTTREEKYKAKQAVDTFFVRFGDLLAGFVVGFGKSLALSIRTFAALNIAVAMVWLGIAVLVLRENRRLSAEKPTERALV